MHLVAVKNPAEKIFGGFFMKHFFSRKRSINIHKMNFMLLGMVSLFYIVSQISTTLGTGFSNFYCLRLLEGNNR